LPEEVLREYRITLVSIKIPEEIPWFKASRRAVVAAILAGGWEGQCSWRAVFIGHSALKNAPKENSDNTIGSFGWAISTRCFLQSVAVDCKSDVRGNEDFILFLS
jgi:hypothetical protein